MTRGDIGPDEASFAGHVKPRRGPLIGALAGNVAIIAALLLLPSLRAELRWQAGRDAYLSFAACILGSGQSTEGVGIALPLHREQLYAAQLLDAPVGWPGQCRGALDAIVPDPAILLLPAAKLAEKDLGRAAALVDNELQALDRLRDQPGLQTLRRSASRLPLRLFLAIDRLSAALSQWGSTISIEGDRTAQGLVAVAPSPIPETSKLPLRAHDTLQTVFAASPTGMEAAALDERGVTHVFARSGGTSARRWRRPALLRDILVGSGTLLLAWTTPRQRCAAVDCSRRGTGLSLLPHPDHLDPPRPRWLAAHPGARPDRAIVGTDTEAWVLGSEAAIGWQVQRFPWAPGEPTPAPAPDEGKRTWVKADGKWTLAAQDELGDALLLWVDGPAAFFTVAKGTEATTLMRLRLSELDAEPEPLASSIVGPEHRLLGCSAGQSAWLLASGASAWRLWQVDGPTSRAAELRALPSDRAALHPEAAALDRVRLACSETRAVLAVRDGAQLLTHVCEGSGEAITCAPGQEVSDNAGAFAVAVDGDRAAVAWAAPEPGSQLRFREITDELGPVELPAPCWDLGAGLCGPPVLALSSGRIVLGGHSGQDLHVVERKAGTVRWQPARGVR